MHAGKVCALCVVAGDAWRRERRSAPRQIVRLSVVCTTSTPDRTNGSTPGRAIRARTKTMTATPAVLKPRALCVEGAGPAGHVLVADA